MRQDGGRLAAARLADQPHPLAREQVEIDPLDGVQLAPSERSNQTCRSLDLSTGVAAVHSESSPGLPTSGRRRNRRTDR